MSIYFKWTEEMSVGEPIIDAQHQKLLSQLNEIIDVATFGANSEKVTNAIEFLNKYIKEHLSYEEEYMLKNNYPGYPEHKKKHDNFAETYVTFKKKLAENITVEELVFEIEQFLGKWWVEHIGEEDKKYHLYFKGK